MNELTMNRLFKIVCSIPLLLVAGIPVMAQVTDKTADEATEIEPPQLYQVELIVFRHLDQAATTGEIPRMPEPEMTDFLEQDLARLAGSPTLTQTAPSPALDVIEVTDTPDEAADAEEGPANEWFPVDPDGLLLAGMVSKIERIPAYELLSYLNWAQVAPDVTVAQAMALEDIGADKALLTGSIELHERRYLHLSLEVLLTDPDTAPDSSLLGPFSGPVTLPALKDSRRIRLEKVQYFDQPQFGVIAVVSRVKVPE
jgi:hypothetical protein